MRAEIAARDGDFSTCRFLLMRVCVSMGVRRLVQRVVGACCETISFQTRCPAAAV